MIEDFLFSRHHNNKKESAPSLSVSREFGQKLREQLRTEAAQMGSGVGRFGRIRGKILVRPWARLGCLLCVWHQTRGGTGGSNFFSEDVLPVAPQPPSFPPSPGGLAWALAVELIYLDQFSSLLGSACIFG